MCINVCNNVLASLLGFQVKRCSLCKPQQNIQIIEFMSQCLSIVMYLQHAFQKAASIFHRALWTSGSIEHRIKSLVFVQPEAKVNSSYYCGAVLNEGKLSGNNFICQQVGAPAYRSRQTVVFLAASSCSRICGTRKLAAE